MASDPSSSGVFSDDDTTSSLFAYPRPLSRTKYARLRYMRERMQQSIAEHQCKAVAICAEIEYAKWIVDHREIQGDIDSLPWRSIEEVTKDLNDLFDYHGDSDIPLRLETYYTDDDDAPLVKYKSWTSARQQRWFIREYNMSLAKLLYDEEYQRLMMARA